MINQVGEIMKPVLLLERRTDPMVFLTSRSLTIRSVVCQGKDLEFCYDYQDIPDQQCFGQSYILLEQPKDAITITASLGEEEVIYEFGNL